MYPEPPGPDRTITWQSVLAGYVLVAAVFGLLLAVSYPTATLAVTAAAVGTYLLSRGLRATHRDVRRPAGRRTTTTHHRPPPERGEPAGRRRRELNG